MDNCDYFEGYPDSKPTVLLDDWRLVPNGELNPYQAPELRRATLHGKVTGHPFHDDGTYVTTSSPQVSAGNVVETYNTIYKLGQMSKGYQEWCFHNGVDVDPKTPIKFAGA